MILAQRAALATLLTAGALATAPAAHASTFDDTIQDLQLRLLNTNRPGLPVPLNAPRSIDRTEILRRAPGDERSVRFFRDLQVRRSGGASTVLGAAMPVDVVSGALTGTVLAMRVGAGLRSFGAYALLGAGTFTTYRHLIPVADYEPVQVVAQSSPFATVGAGAEVRLFRTVVFATELGFGHILASTGPQRVIAPTPAESVRSAVMALRVEY